MTGHNNPGHSIKKLEIFSMIGESVYNSKITGEQTTANCVIH